MRTKIKKIKDADPKAVVGKEVTIKGWVRTVREQKDFSFLEINDGSTLSGFQVILLPDETADYQDVVKELTTGSSVVATGEIVESPGKGQAVEMRAKKVIVVGKCPAEGYPLQKKRHSLEFLRSMAHLRPRTNTIGAVARVRNAASYATHRFFQERGFINLHTPIITASDCEGAGEMFRVTTLNSENPPRNSEGKVDYEQDFFGRPTYLTVSGQLNGEIYACALSDIYTFGPTFRSENSNTSRHLAEFWMIEPEMAFADINDNMDNAEEYIKYILEYVLEHCPEEMQFFNKFIAEGILERLQHVVKTPFERISYSDAIEILEKANKKFDFPVTWGTDLQSEHERYLCEEHFNKPVIISGYPKDIKAFYMRLNDDGKTVAAMDICVPGVGEIVGGSQREERYDVLEKRIVEAGLPLDDYWWYLELRKFGSVPHAGYGVGFERLIQYITGVQNIRDVIPFPRFPQHAEF